MVHLATENNCLSSSPAASRISEKALLPGRKGSAGLGGQMEAYVSELVSSGGFQKGYQGRHQFPQSAQLEESKVEKQRLFLLSAAVWPRATLAIPYGVRCETASAGSCQTLGVMLWKVVSGPDSGKSPCRDDLNDLSLVTMVQESRA